jgi:anthranilate synthase/aminodeoxychorismate synthase-like glutamine amidotransferase
LILLVDNYDSFTWNLVDYIRQQGEEVEIVRNDTDPDQLKPARYKGILLSPGPGRPSESGNLLQFVDKFAGQLPLLGICLGHQAVGEYFGAALTRAASPMHGKISKISCHKYDPLFKGVPSEFNVVRYHSLVLQDLPADLVTLATSSEEIMIVKHTRLPVYGIQFHPEAYLTDFGNRIIANWIEICNRTVVE